MPGNCVQTEIMYWVLVDQGADSHFERLGRYDRQSEYGMTPTELLAEHPAEAMLDVQDYWDKLDKPCRQELLRACIDRVDNKISEMNDLRALIYNEWM